MRWQDGGESSDIEDRRDESGGGGGGGFGFGGMHIGIGGALILLVLSLIFHQNFFALLGGGGGGGSAVQSGPATSGQPNSARDQAEEPLVHFISFVLDDTQKTWAEILPQQSNRQYHKAHLVLYPRLHARRLRQRRIRHRPLLLPLRSKGLHRSRLLRRAQSPLRRTRPIRASLRSRPRNGPPHSKYSWDRTPGRTR